MVCAYCADKIFDEPIRVAGEYYCSQHCASLAGELDPEEGEGYYEESELEGLYEEEE